MSKFQKGDMVLKKADNTTWEIRDCWGTNCAIKRKVFGGEELDNVYEDDLELLMRFEKKGKD